MAKHRSSGGGSTLYGVLAGLLIGLMVAAAVAYYVVKAPSPFLDKASRSPDAPSPKDPSNVPDPNVGLGGRDVVTATPVNPDTGAQVPVPSAGKSEKSAASSDDLGALIATLKPAPVNTSVPRMLPPKAETRTETPASNAINSSQTSAGAPYYLQVGSFKVLEEAETMRARIILMGLPVEVRRAEISGVQFNRVRVGPFSKIDDMNKTRARLGEEKIPTAVVRQ